MQSPKFLEGDLVYYTKTRQPYEVVAVFPSIVRVRSLKDKNKVFECAKDKVIHGFVQLGYVVVKGKVAGKVEMIYHNSARIITLNDGKTLVKFDEIDIVSA